VIVLDASASIEWLLGRLEGERVASLLAEPGQSVHVPHVWGVEVAQALRRLLSGGSLTAARAGESVSELWGQVVVDQQPHAGCRSGTSRSRTASAA
jgi:predicted nucleic acid-binding protein